MAVDYRSILSSEVTAFRHAMARGFGTDLDEEEANDRFEALLPLPRTVAAFDGDDIVGTLGDFEFEVTVPGGASVPMAGTTMITVRATHRRRGILTSMVRRHLEIVAERGDPLAGLWASEAPIYGRFGYGAAADRQAIEFHAGTVELPPGPVGDEVRLIELEEAIKLLPQVYLEVRGTRAGMLARTDPWWTHRRFHDPVSQREGRSARRHVIAVRSGVPVGYAVYRQKEKWDDWVPRGEVGVVEVVAVDDGARRTLWRYLSSIDLFPAVEWWNAPLDHPITFEVPNPRLLQRKVTDTLWMRLLDVPRALEARRYEGDGRIVIGVADGFLPDNGGTYELVVDGGEGRCRRSSDEPDVTLGADTLGALYLGGRSAPQFASAGRISGAAADVVRLDRIFGTALAPWCPEVF